MQITVLNANQKGLCPSEHGLLLIESDKKVLFDTGSSNLFIKNAKKLKKNLNDIDYVILSHGHDDHGGGLPFIKNTNLVCHPDAFLNRYSKKDDGYCGLPISLSDAKKVFNLILSKNPFKISKNILFLGEITRINDFEAKSTNFYDIKNNPDFIIDDSALTIKSKKGLIIITGCSHAGICNIIEYSKKIAKTKKVYAVIGGFHLKETNAITSKTLDYLKKQKIEKIYPLHCTYEPVIKEFEKELNIIRVGSGDIIKF